MTNQTRRNFVLGSNSIGKEAASAMTSNKIMPHDEFLKRIRRTLYVGGTVPTMTAPSSNSQKISRPLADYAAEYFSETHRGHSLNRLNYVAVSKLDVTPCSLIIAMIYLDRLQHSDPTHARKITPTELFLVSMLVSSKFYSGYDEDVMDIEDFANHGQIPLEQMKRMEIELLVALDWNVMVSNKEFFDKLCTVEHDLALKQGCARGWLTYTELVQLFPSLSIAKAFLKYSTVFALSYTASVFTIAGAFLLASQVPGTSLYRASMDPTVRSSSPPLNTTSPIDRAPPADPAQSNTNCCPGEATVEVDPANNVRFEPPESDTAANDDDKTAPSNHTWHHLDIPDHQQSLRNIPRPTHNHSDDEWSIKFDWNKTSIWNRHQLLIDDAESCQAADSYGPLLMWLQYI